MDEIQVFKSFFKVYDAKNFLVTVIGIESIRSDYFIEELETLIDEGYSVIPTTYDIYIEFQIRLNLGTTDRFEDLKAQNISC
jgi:hypothetical protein